ncbi:hypothetical protein niasHS_016702 [Heterodera schachtii]|uniref:MATH domain-containing protein n=1 Tax=Heterodera schachtii TaxID=97005 RepID=A0ABD2IE21_HETSC
MLSTGEYADLQFLVGDGDAKEATTANCPVVEVPDVETAAFKVMLRFIYTDELSGLNGDNAMAVLYAAKKYNIPALVDAALQIPISKLRNVFFAFAQARLFDLENFVNDCLRYIDENADDLLKSESFLKIDQKLLCEILERDQLKMREEISIWEANSTGTFYEHVYSNESSNSPGFTNFISFAEMVDPSNCFSSGEEYKVTVAIDLSVKNEKIDKSILLLDPCKSTGTVTLEIEKMSEFAREVLLSGRKSEAVTYIKGLPWKILAQINQRTESTKKCLGIFLFCAAPKEENWSCKCSATIRIVSKKCDWMDLWKECNTHVMNNENSGWGLKQFISLAHLMDPSNGFYNQKEDRVTLAIDFSVKEAKTENKS